MVRSGARRSSGAETIRALRWLIARVRATTALARVLISTRSASRSPRLRGRTVLQRPPATPGPGERTPLVPVARASRRSGQAGPPRHPKTRSPRRHSSRVPACCVTCADDIFGKCRSAPSGGGCAGSNPAGRHCDVSGHRAQVWCPIVLQGTAVVGAGQGPDVVPGVITHRARTVVNMAGRNSIEQGFEALVCTHVGQQCHRVDRSHVEPHDRL
jgi:hypothetical protein